jgi:eukaryotic-like serine/threonine-protein kinase
VEGKVMTIEEIFLAAIEKPSVDRGVYLDLACGTDAKLRTEVEALIRSHEEAGSLLEQPLFQPGVTVVQLPADEHIGAVVGPYTLIEQIGEGGMGTVFMAQQGEPVKRLVALKLIKPGMDSKQVLARFEAERQALALMDHPNIAKVFDAGSTGQPSGVGAGRPFFVMELIKGVPITKYCDEHRLTPKERLELFIPVCQAIQHAHQQGIIHRDIKPSNVLIALYDGRPVPKVIDFGIAKATGQQLTEQTLITGFGAVVGTLEYMSPEQAQLNQLDIDTRSDIYSLGVLLYELLTGTTPLKKKRLKEAAMLEALRLIREEEPPRPSTRLSTTAEMPSIAANRSLEPKRLTGLVRGELDWIVMKALEKERSLRYETANGFAMDVQRYLAGEPVLAAPANLWYRLRKTVRRNRGPVIAASLVLLALVGGVIGTTAGMLQADEAVEQERLAKIREAQRADGEQKAKVEAESRRSEAEARRQEAERNLAFAKKGNEILGSVFAGLDPRHIAESGRPLQDVLRENLDKAVKELEGSAIGDPLEVAAMQNTLGLSLLNLGEHALAVEVLDKALQTRQAKLGPGHRDTLFTMSHLASGHKDAGRFDKALPLYQETVKLSRENLGPDDPLTLGFMNNLALGYQAGKQLDKAVPLYEDTLKAMNEKLGTDDPVTLTVLNNLAMAYQEAGKVDKALPLLKESLKLTKQNLGPEHPNTLGGMNNLAVAYWRLKRLDQSIPLFEKTLPLQQKTLGRQHPQTQMTVANLGVNYLDAGRLPEAIPLLEEAQKASKKHPNLNWVASSLQDAYTKTANLGVNLLDAGRLQEAMPLLEEAYRASKKHPDLSWVALKLQVAYLMAGEFAKFTDLLQEQLPETRKSQPRDGPELARMLALIGWGLLEQKKWAEAEPMLRESLAIRAKTQPDAWNTFNTQTMLGGALLGQKKYQDAEPQLLDGYEGMKKRDKMIPPQNKKHLPEAIDRLIELYTMTNRPEEAKKWQAERVKYPSAKK